MSEILTSDTAFGYEDCIANGIPSRAFRYAAENKNLLDKSGSLYVGTGIPRTTTMLLDAIVWSEHTEDSGEYNPGDIVNHNGKTWRCNKTTDSKANPVPGSDSPSETDPYWVDVSVGFVSYKTTKLEPPDAPNTTWTLKAVVDANGVATLQWVPDQGTNNNENR